MNIWRSLQWELRALQQAVSGDVWTGHRDGYVRVWSEQSRRPVCQAKRVFHSDIKCVPRALMTHPKGSVECCLLASIQKCQ